MFKKILLLVGLLYILHFTHYPALSAAVGNIKIGRTEVHPYLGLKTILDDNIYLDAKNTKSSLIMTLTPGINLALPVDDHKFGLGIHADLLNYSEKSSQNNAVHTTIDILSDLKFPVGVNFKLKDTFRNTTDPAYSELVERIKRVQNDLSADLGYTINNYISAGISYSQTSHNYEKAQYQPSLNRIESETGLTVFYSASPKTSVLVEYDLGTINYENINNSNDSAYGQIRVGLKGKLTPKTIGILKVGQQNRKYNQLTGQDANPPTLSLSTLTDFSERTGLRLVANRDFIQSIYAPNPYYISTGLTIELNQKIVQKWAGTVTVRYETNDYPNATTESNITKKRQDNYPQLGFGIKYDILEWVQATAGYLYKERNSNFDSFDYKNSLINLGVTATF